MKIDLSLIEFVNILDCSKEDQKKIREIRNELTVRNNMYNHNVITEDEHAKWIIYLKENSLNQTSFLIYYKNSLVGYISIFKIDLVNKSAVWGFYVDPKCIGYGLGASIEFKFLDYFFYTLNLKILNCEVLEFNIKVIALHKKFGFSQENVKKREILRDGIPISINYFYITKEQWDEKRKDMKEKFVNYE
jgi:UDP-4-amino-4,6-dideoxy-N-acetyl-beta-L-altrosamine N-acetyltransferase